jgi:NADH pyrophosphatase NudC (nudix superfamily)
MEMGWCQSADAVWNIYGTEATTVMYEALDCFSLGTVHEVEIDKLSFHIFGHWEGRQAKIIGLQNEELDTSAMNLVHISNLFYDMHDGTLLACNWAGHATRLELIIPLLWSGNMLHV